MELFNGEAAMLGLVIGVITEGLTGAGIAHQIGLGALVDGYAACRTSSCPSASKPDGLAWQNQPLKH